MTLKPSGPDSSWPPKLPSRPRPLRIPCDDLENDNVAVPHTPNWTFMLAQATSGRRSDEPISARKPWRRFLKLPRWQHSECTDHGAGRNDELYLCISPFLASGSTSTSSFTSPNGPLLSTSSPVHENTVHRQREPLTSRPENNAARSPGRARDPRTISQSSVLQPEDALLALVERGPRCSALFDTYAMHTPRRFSLPGADLAALAPPPVLDPVPHYSLSIPGLDRYAPMPPTRDAADMARISSDAARSARERRRKNRSRENTVDEVDLPPSYEDCVRA